MNKIIQYVADKKIWVSLEETTDAEGRFVANFIVGTLEVGCPGKTFLLNCEVVEKANHSIVAKMFNNSLSLLWPGSIQYDNVLLFVSDAARTLHGESWKVNPVILFKNDTYDLYCICTASSH